MGRHSIYKKPMTDARRQQRRRLKVKREAFAAKIAASTERRRRSREARPIPDGMDHLRIGDCREALADVADNAEAMVLTDPPYRRPQSVAGLGPVSSAGPNALLGNLPSSSPPAE
jgi:hypothetical protein